MRMIQRMLIGFLSTLIVLGALGSINIPIPPHGRARKWRKSGTAGIVRSGG